MAFEVYKPRIEKEATIAISKNHLTLNKKLLDKINTRYVELAYDPETRTIRIKPSTTDNGLVLNRNKIGARGFFKHFKIDQKGKYNVVYNEKEKALYIQI
ncbi:MAG: hypothetical protein ACOX86_06755 [Pelotomaculaceae bacterium]|jgi:hypothetical protein|nr:hypothetical protein [Bacillota bacterium]HHU86423.1 hypothetical protein [Peptococcaceae bacterium]